jgi:hypothetical protein
MQINHTGYRKEPLNSTGAGGDFPTPVIGNNTKWSLSSLPLTNGNGLAYYLPYLLLEVTGVIDNNCGNNRTIYWDCIFRALIDSIAIQGAWHGTPMNSGSFKGVYAYLLEFVMGGYQHIQRAQPRIGSAGTEYFNAQLAIPLSIGLGQKPHHTAQLAAVYRNATVVINWASATPLGLLSTGATLTYTGARLSAMLLPSPELIMAPPIEVVEYTTPAPSGGGMLDFTDFGKTTGINGTENEAGVLFAMLMRNTDDAAGTANAGASGRCGFDGAFAPENITRIGLPWRDQPDTNHVRAFVADALDAMGPARVIGSTVIAAAAAGQLEDLSGYPHAMGATLVDSAAGQTGLPATLLGIPLVSPGYQLDLSKIQAVSRNIKINLLGTQSGTHRLLAVHVRQWTMEMRQAWREYVIKEGIAKEVLGDAPDFNAYRWEGKTKNKQRLENIDPKKARFLPWRLQNASAMRRTH